jgi:hypothetical protein
MIGMLLLLEKIYVIQLLNLFKNHFTSCYEVVKQQLQEERSKERENVLVSRSMILGETNNTLSRNTSTC